MQHRALRATCLPSPCAGCRGAGEARLLGTGLFCEHGDAVSPVCSGSAALAPGPRGGGESGPSPSRRALGGCFCRSDLRGDDGWREGEPDLTQPGPRALRTWVPPAFVGRGSLSSLGTELDGGVV